MKQDRLRVAVGMGGLGCVLPSLYTQFNTSPCCVWAPKISDLQNEGICGL